MGDASVTTRTLCPVGRRQAEPCPRKVSWQLAGKPVDPCRCCLEDWAERAAIAEHDGHLPRMAAEVQATAEVRFAVDESARAPKQGSLF